MESRIRITWRADSTSASCFAGGGETSGRSSGCGAAHRPLVFSGLIQEKATIRTKTSANPVFHLCSLLAVLMVLGGCRQEKPPLSAPPLELRVEHFAGGALAGPSTRPVAGFTPTESLAAEVRLMLLESMPGSLGRPLGTEARFIAATRSGMPVLPGSRLTRGARVISLDGAAAFDAQLTDRDGRIAEIGVFHLALPVGVTGAVHAVEAAGSERDPIAGSAMRRGVAVSLHRPAARQLVLALTIDNLVEPEGELTAVEDPTDAAAPAAVPKGTPERELALVDMGMPADELAFAVIVPFQFEQGEATAIAAIVDIRAGSDDPEHAATALAALEEIRRTSGMAASRPSAAPISSSEWAGLLVAAASLDDPARRRSAMAYLTLQTGANLCSDVALTADDALLGALTAAVREVLKASPATNSMDAVGWLLDRTAFEFAGKLLAKEALPDELRAVLAFHCGEAGRHAASVEEVSRARGSRREFDTKLIEENLIFLEDSSPSSRVRAYDWLNARKLAPAGYDPLGDARDRRNALERALTGPTGNTP